MERVCNSCKEIKNLNLFFKQKKGKYGHTATCKECCKIKEREKYNSSEATRLIKKTSYAKYRLNNLEKRREYNRAWEASNKDKCKNTRLKKTFGITLDQYNSMLNNQNGVCAICKNPETALYTDNKTIKNLAIDHCHKTGNIRGLLCSRCNTGIGHFKENLDYLNNAIDYLSTNRPLIAGKFRKKV